VTEGELVDLYNRAKVVVCASYLEPFGLVPLEAMSCGTPVVAMREGGYRESILHEETGLLVARNEEAIGEAIGRILGDDALRERLGKHGAEYVRSRFSLDKYWDNLARHLSAVP
jgi:glycosyltransferase involved in cell wall biosynthesis